MFKLNFIQHHFLFHVKYEWIRFIFRFNNFVRFELIIQINTFHNNPDLQKYIRSLYLFASSSNRISSLKRCFAARAIVRKDPLDTMRTVRVANSVLHSDAYLHFLRMLTSGVFVTIALGQTLFFKKFYLQAT